MQKGFANMVNAVAALTVLWVAVPPLSAQSDTWSVIQERILNRNCISCHNAGSSFVRQSGLVLTSDVAYTNLIDVTPKNPAAAADGLVRVSSAGDLSAPQKSFLWEKINAPEQSHFYQDHPDYGAMMPLGLPPLTNGELAFIKAWILAGAPETGVVADETLLADTTRYEEPEFIPLDPPEHGFQLHVGPFEVWLEEIFDREFLFFVPLVTETDLFVKRYEISYRPGSHHFLIFHYPPGASTPTPNVYRDMRTPSGTPNLQNLLQLRLLFPFYFFIGTQVPYTNYAFPPGVALRLPPGLGFDLNAHSVNRSDTTRLGEVYTNLYLVDRSEVQHIADYDNFGNYDIFLPPNQVTTLSKTFYVSETRHIIQMWSHSHEHTVEFRVEGVGGEHDGQLLYWNNDWEHPPLMRLDPPLTLRAGDGVRLVTTYNNWTDQAIHFGPLSSDEMQFLFYIYYTDEVTSVADPARNPEAFWLGQNYPNPFNPVTTIEYRMPHSGHVSLAVYDVLGRRVATLVERAQSAGRHRVVFDAGNLASGVYYYRLRAGGQTLARKLLLIR